MKNQRSSFPMQDCDLLFAYGTLITGKAPAGILHLMSRHMLRVGEGRAKGFLYDLGKYPGMIPGKSWVLGEVWRMSSPRRCLKELDEYEDFRPGDSGSEYVRRLDEVEMFVPPQKARAWIYYYNGSLAGCPRIQEGDYRKTS